MPPKKRKAATASKSDGTHTMWLLIYASKGCRGGPQEEREEVLYSTREKAISGLPNLMDKFANIGNDWRDGLKGFGREEADPYLGFKYFGITARRNKDGGILLSNAHKDGARPPITVSIKRMLVDPPDSEVGR
ncbi:hypothetical protein FRACYDRAFT_244094 [Fragilariopsis cylindrus CCMP1102]|uniref:Uncharacterized protein n=1 Tax=Fragilariopsis cylindrus CCMP1102 TaxID=635003 RepID=A0A1E7F3V0_9STRA|nr:hypothetical protein FRACYDRAFT_244094 [Fragilariopsis cylindrus CCMP1102]|eukprot:OEU12819.1 hypothetical protein FRACYDRAFT_244094 [Fragilariopsis cylindrus CCMP1102]